MSMEPSDYLREILKQQTLAEDGDELKALRERRTEVEQLLKDTFTASKISVRYGGSKAKNTMILENYDLDLVCYFSDDEAAAGQTLEEIYQNVSKALQKNYSITEKTSAIRLSSKDRIDFHVDVVPGRFTDGTKGDVYIYQKSAEKCRLKTNLDVHISHIRDSGFIDAIRLMKLWSVRNGLWVKTFILELMVIDLLKGLKGGDFKAQIVRVLTEFRDNINNIDVEDPANPNGNDLTSMLDPVRTTLSNVASTTLNFIEAEKWEQVFGQIEKPKGWNRISLAAAAVSTTQVAAKPWATNRRKLF